MKLDWEDLPCYSTADAAKYSMHLYPSTASSRAPSKTGNQRIFSKMLGRGAKWEKIQSHYLSNQNFRFVYRRA